MIYTPNDTVEALKGNLKIINLTDQIEKLELKMKEFARPYQTQQQLDYQNQFKHKPAVAEPTWPPGKKRLMARKFKIMADELFELVRLRDKVGIQTFGPDEYYDYDFEISIVIKKK